MEIRGKDGASHSRHKPLVEIVTSYFSKLFTSSNSSRIDEIIQHVETKFTEEMNGKLCWPYLVEEVEAVLPQMHPSKVPGPDGFNPYFYQKFWPIIGERYPRL